MNAPTSIADSYANKDRASALSATGPAKTRQCQPAGFSESRKGRRHGRA